MSVGYAPVQWSRPKRVYDAICVAGIGAYVAIFVVAGKLAWRGEHAISDEVLILRASGSCAIVLLHVILSIGPLARLDTRFLPVLFNRRHLGVMTFFVALAHGAVAIGYYHGFGVIGALRSLLISNTNYASLASFPFETLGLIALVILALLAVTSHDFWLKNMGSRAWKSLHMLVYIAYALLVGHIALGALQRDAGWVVPGLVFTGLVWLSALHITAGLREVRQDTGRESAGGEWIDAGEYADVPERRARTVCAPGGERIAIFKHKGEVSAVTNVCAHQGGPLGEGAIIDGCITCPWHGWQYRPQDGCSPPPFQEKIATYQVRVVAGRVQVNTKAQPRARDLRRRDLRINTSEVLAMPDHAEELYVNYLPMPPRYSRWLRLVVPLFLWTLCAAAFAWAWSQNDPGNAVWNDATPVQVTGMVFAQPYPMLLASEGAYLLVEQGKRGCRSVAELAGKRCTLSGWLLNRDGRRILELEPDQAGVRVIGERSSAAADWKDVRLASVQGEIVDAKCFLGAMKPGDGKTHKQCASLCVRGGIPPMLVTRNSRGELEYVLLISEDNGPLNERVLDFVADPVEVAGTLVDWNGLAFLRVQANGIRRR